MTDDAPFLHKIITTTSAPIPMEVVEAENFKLWFALAKHGDSCNESLVKLGGLYPDLCTVVEDGTGDTALHMSFAKQNERNVLSLLELCPASLLISNKV